MLVFEKCSECAEYKKCVEFDLNIYVCIDCLYKKEHVKDGKDDKLRVF